MRAVLALLLATGAVAQGPVDARLARAEGRFVQALTALQIGDDSLEARALDDVLDEAPDDPTVLAARAEAALRLGDAPDAVFYARQAADAAPERPDVLRQLAAALRAAGQPAEAADALRRATRAAPDDLDAWLAAADLAAETGDAEAEAEALRALVRLGDTVGARLRLSALAERAGDRDAALAEARAASRLSPADPAVRRRLDALSGEAGRPVPSPTVGAASGDAEALRASVDADPGRLDLWLQLLAALAETRAPGAGAAADDALLLFPTVPAVLAAAAEAYAAADRPADAADAARRGLDALNLVGDALPPDEAEDLRRRLDAVLR